MKLLSVIILLGAILGLGVGCASALGDKVQPDWEAYDKMQNEGKPRQALSQVQEIRAKAIADDDQAQWTRALVEEVKIQVGLQAAETAAEVLLTQPWPSDKRWRDILGLYRAQALLNYLNQYSYQIRSRESIRQLDSTDVATWSVDQLATEIHQSFSQVWGRRQSWSDKGLEDWSLYLKPNTYPARIRSTLRDAVTYQWMEYLTNTRLWSPEQSNQIYQLDLDELMDGDRQLSAEGPDSLAHPLQQLSYILADLRQWHLSSDRPEAAHEAQLELLRHLRNSMENEEDRVRLRQKLEALQKDLDDDLQWWSFGQWRLAKFLQQEKQPANLVMAHRAARLGSDRHPKSDGGMLCAAVVVEIEQPSLDVRAMAQDAPQKRSLVIRHQNLERVYLRAWRYDWDDNEPLRRRLLDPPDQNEITAWLEYGEPDFVWSVDLPATDDFHQHQTYTSLPECEPGPYVVVISTRDDFAAVPQGLISLQILVSDLVLQANQWGIGWELQTTSGVTGEPQGQVELEIIQKFRSRDHQTTTYKLHTDQRGLATITPEPRTTVSVLARQGNHLALLENLRAGYDRQPRDRQQCFIYTDRSIYRPGQTVHWKAIVYVLDGEGRDHRTVPDQHLEVSLRDANGQEAGLIKCTTNGFGSTSGQFTLPEGGLLGSWNLLAQGLGRARIKVEEYKRPTFEVELDDLAGQPELNQLVQLEGRAVYYFGQPVTEGEVNWHVVRTPTFKFWPRWRPEPPRTQTIASGQTVLGDAGTYQISFTPEADGRFVDDPLISYRYSVKVDVTSSAGETRNASRSYRLGFTGVEASLSSDAGFLVAGQKGMFTAKRTNLDGNPLAGPGSWQIKSLVQPETTPLPADLPEITRSFLATTPGDTLRPRWAHGRFGWQQMESWGDGPVVAEGSLVHGEDGLARIAVEDLEAGAYRLSYQTSDGKGRPATANQDFIVAGTARTSLAMPLIVRAENNTVRVGDTARILIHSGLADQPLRLEFMKEGKRIRDEFLVAGKMNELLEIPITEDLRGGFTIRVHLIRDFQSLEGVTSITVPHDNKDLQVEFLSFRDLIVPGTPETFRLRVTGPDSQAVNASMVEVLAYMYDRSLDLFGPHSPPRPRSIFRQQRSGPRTRMSLGHANPNRLHHSDRSHAQSVLPQLRPDQLLLGNQMRFSRKAGLGSDHLMSLDMAPAMDVEGASYMVETKSAVSESALSLPAGNSNGAPPPPPEADQAVREDFSESGFFAPHVELDADGVAVIEFVVPDAVTDWNVWAHAFTRDLRSGQAHRTVSSRKDLMVRPYLPRFLREGDQAVLKVLVDNAGDQALSGQVRLSLTDPVTGADLAADFGIADPQELVRKFDVEPDASTDLTFNLTTPSGAGSVVCKVVARAADLSDGEQHQLPILPGRLHLMQSRFVSLDGKDRQEMTFAEMDATGTDASLIHDQLVITVDAQLFQGVLAALPYLVDYPYECTEQTLNRFLCSSIVSGVFSEHPTVKQMAEQLPDRDTRLPAWQKNDPNRKMQLEETPWLVQSRGGGERPDQLINILDPETARQQKTAALAKLEKMQTAGGGFPWWGGGRPSPYLTLYVLQGFSRAREFGVEIPTPMAQRAWQFLHGFYLQDITRDYLEKDTGWPLITFLNYLLSGLPEDSLAGTGFTEEERDVMLDFSFRHWKEHSRLLKGQLALTLARSGRPEDARLVLDSVMDGAITDPQLGTSWAPESRAWLWYQDTVEAHAFLLRVLTELDPEDDRRSGLVKWLFLNRQLGHWKSTKATAEVIYALVYYLQEEDALAVHETITLTMGPQQYEMNFDPARYTGQDNHIRIAGEDVVPEDMSTIAVTKDTPGLAFASATWHFSTDRLPTEAEGDLLGVTRQYFKRHQVDRKWQLDPLTEEDVLEVGDQVEVHLEISARHAAEYVHLRDPRGSGFEPESLTSGHRWEGGLGHYLEIRDSGTNFFFDRLPAGSYTLRYRLRVTMAGRFKVGPAVLQSMYAPEFTAYSAGAMIRATF